MRFIFFFVAIIAAFLSTPTFANSDAATQDSAAQELHGEINSLLHEATTALNAEDPTTAQARLDDVSTLFADFESEISQLDDARISAEAVVKEKKEQLDAAEQQARQQHTISQEEDVITALDTKVKSLDRAIDSPSGQDQIDNVNLQIEEIKQTIEEITALQKEVEDAEKAKADATSKYESTQRAYSPLHAQYISISKQVTAAFTAKAAEESGRQKLISLQSQLESQQQTLNGLRDCRLFNSEEACQASQLEEAKNAIRATTAEIATHQAELFSMKRMPTQNLLSIGGQQQFFSLPSFIASIISLLVGLAGTLAFGFVLVAGVRMMVAGSDDTELTRAKEMLVYALIGLGLSLMAYFIILFVQGIIYRA